jgi:hypothetical protein
MDGRYVTGDIDEAKIKAMESERYARRDEVTP